MVATTLSIKDVLARLNQVDESHEIEAKRSESELGKSALDTNSEVCASAVEVLAAHGRVRVDGEVAGDGGGLPAVTPVVDMASMEDRHYRR